MAAKVVKKTDNAKAHLTFFALCQQEVRHCLSPKSGSCPALCLRRGTVLEPTYQRTGKEHPLPDGPFVPVSEGQAHGKMKLKVAPQRGMQNGIMLSRRLISRIDGLHAEVEA